MAPTPRPEGWKGGSEDFEFVRTLDGHIGFNPFEDDARAVDVDIRRNARGPGEWDLGGSYSADVPSSPGSGADKE